MVILIIKIFICLFHYFFYDEEVNNCWASIFWSGQAKACSLLFLGQVNILIFPQPCPKCFESVVYIVVFLKLMQKF